MEPVARPLESLIQLGSLIQLELCRMESWIREQEMVRGMDLGVLGHELLVLLSLMNRTPGLGAPTDRACFDYRTQC